MRMDFGFQQHMRLAGAIAALAGVLIHNWMVIIFGWAVVVVGYMMTIMKIEYFIENFKEKEEDDAIR